MITRLNVLKAYLTGFTLGSLIAAGVALLYAPHSGEETRSQIRDLGREAQLRTQELLQRTQQRANRALNDTTRGAIDEASALLDRGQEVLDTTRLKIETGS
jgi:gas vesicle protein